MNEHKAIEKILSDYRYAIVSKCMNYRWDFYDDEIKAVHEIESLIRKKKRIKK